MKTEKTYIKYNQLLAFTLVILGSFSFHIVQDRQHQSEMASIIENEAQVKDSMATYIEEMAAALDLFTEGHPLVFTAYNAMVNQTDDTPNITASNKEIFPGVLALSRELITRYGYGGDVQYGDKVWMVVPMQVEDTMNKRWRGRGDVFMLDYHEARQFGSRQGILYTAERDADFAHSIEDTDTDVSTLN
ncbi:MAG: hypothetical protein K9M49_01070 [Candidatus Marinimicrobia bacterium]|nr:hypothetical protein [Candidatus Neomarinimicrobiota bacterium]MCF7850240.1 hypothetical protein [Candidatus Neomarinimicrobiota bacterium]MCF7903718.1 hypothetical protein [Candidatus Neomarinimicrobiota bacterium]